MAIIKYSLFLVILKCSYSVLEKIPPKVKINDGEIVGGVYETVYGREIYEFQGIPYAAPPIGENRFESPKPVKPWVGEWNATLPRNICLQQTPINYAILGEEDCLYLNIYTPELPDDNSKLLDVIVFLFGGCFTFGGGNLTKPDYLFRHGDIVFITLNHRIGPFGFLSTGDEVIPGNYGLKDLVAALQWIQKNIAKFGGNPSRVTISGMSSGAASVHYLLLSPMSEGLFHRVISQSGSALVPRARPYNLRPRSERLASLVGCPTRCSREMLNCLKKIPARRIIEKVKELMIWRFNPSTLFGPVVEPLVPGNFLSENPIDIIRHGKVKNIPWMISTTKDEGLHLVADFFENEVMKEINDNWNNLAPYILNYNSSVLPEIRDTVSEKVRQHYFGPEEQITLTNYKKLTKVIGDRLYTAYIEFTIREQAKANPGPIYYYKFNYEGKYSLSHRYTNNRNCSGVSHGDDTQYPVRIFYGNPHENPKDQQMIDFMAPLWLTFAQTGKPEVKNINWPSVSRNPKKDGIAYLQINSPYNIKVENIKDTKAFDFWNSMVQEYQEEEILCDNLHEEF